jgi:hypothetical protein
MEEIRTIGKSLQVASERFPDLVKTIERTAAKK